eukprot:Skav208505  [mRNA]  locus=scaffold1658:157211:160919:- [translate_table: standard]
MARRSRALLVASLLGMFLLTSTTFLQPGQRQPVSMAVGAASWISALPAWADNFDPSTMPSRYSAFDADRRRGHVTSRLSMASVPPCLAHRTSYMFELKNSASKLANAKDNEALVTGFLTSAFLGLFAAQAP